MAKCEVLPVGMVPGGQQPAAEVCGMRLVSKAKCLGIMHSDSGINEADWEGLLGKVHTAYTRINGLGLSAFGRAAAASAYGMSQLLFHSEFADMPHFVLDKLESWTKGLVDRKAPPPVRGAPSHGRRRPPGIHSVLLVGKPGAGGFGAMPWHKHIVARHVVWAGAALHGLATAQPSERPRVGEVGSFFF